MLAALRAGGARATFFVWGARAARYPGLLREVRAAGMWVGNHAYAHPRLTRIAEPAAFVEIARTQRVIKRITGQAPVLFRPPYGDTNAAVRAHEARLGLTEVLWTVDTKDWDGATAAQIVRAAARVRPGGIVLMHDNGFQTTVDAIPVIIERLAARGLRPGRIARDGVVVAP